MQEDQEQKRNVMLFFAISLIVMLGYPYVFKSSTPVQVSDLNNQSQEISTISSKAQSSDTRLASKRENTVPQAEVKTIEIRAPRISGTISTKGLKFSDVNLNDYTQEYDNQDKVSIFGKENYFAASGWKSDDKSLILPDENSCWETDSTKLTPESPITLTWDNGSGLIFTKKISVDENFVFTITDEVKNNGAEAVRVKNTTLIYREVGKDKSESIGFYHGPIGYFDGKLREVGYEDIDKEKEISYKSRGGWFGITDKYWLVSFIPEHNSSYSVNYKSLGKGNYAIESSEDWSVVNPSSKFSKDYHLFIGAKEINTLDMYEEKLNVPHLDLVIDFGYLYILTKPLLYAMSYVKGLVGNMGFGILLITLLLKLLLFPLANRAYRSMNRMKTIQPKIKALQTKYAGDQMKLGQAVSELYKKEKVNPLGGCLPMFLQWPILFALYKVLYISIEMRQAPFIWWIHDLSVADPWSILNLGGLIPVTLPGFLQIGIWPLLMGLSMWIQQKMGPAPADPSQAKMMMIMPIMFTLMFSRLPSGLIIYWTFSNLFAIVQQYVIRKVDEKNALAKSEVKSGAKS
ncbi:MAG: membrane protein insertase YidC [Alphaproteobacteria bacterium]|nr:membrane protein insertase YidC [Alphaproteobacteria bacterium]